MYKNKEVRYMYLRMIVICLSLPFETASLRNSLPGMGVPGIPTSPPHAKNCSRPAHSRDFSQGYLSKDEFLSCLSDFFPRGGIPDRENSSADIFLYGRFHCHFICTMSL